MKDRKQLQASAADHTIVELRFERTRAASRGEDTRLIDAALVASTRPPRGGNAVA